MKAVLLAIIYAAWMAVSAAAQAPIVVELFTSEGCSSCPPADALAAQVSQMKAPNGSPILLLGEHVDYWNHDGWKDRFSSSEFTARQQDYASRFKLASPYTPQMIIDGTTQFVGNDKGQLVQAITQAAQKAKPASLTLKMEGVNTVRISGEVPDVRRARLFVAVTEDNLTSQVAAGENNGRTLRHAGVVRALYDLGTLKPGQFERTRPVEVDSRWNAANMKVIVWVQESSNGPILGAASLPYRAGSPPQTTASAR